MNSTPCLHLFCSDVRGNNLTGTIPDNIGNCTSFEILWVFLLYFRFESLLFSSKDYTFAYQGYFLQPDYWRDSIQYWLSTSGHTVSLFLDFTDFIMYMDWSHANFIARDIILHIFQCTVYLSMYVAVEIDVVYLPWTGLYRGTCWPERFLRW